MPDRKECEFEIERLLRDYEFAVTEYDAEMNRTLKVDFGRVMKPGTRYELLDEVISSLQEERRRLAEKIFEMVSECIT